MLEKGVSARSSFFGLSGARLRAFAAIPFFLFRVALASEKHLFAKPIKNQCKINGFGLSWSCSGCSRGHPWGPLGPAGGAQGLVKRRLEAPFLSWTGSGGLLRPTWALEGLMTTPGDPCLLLFGLLLVYVLMFLFVVSSFSLASNARVLPSLVFATKISCVFQYAKEIASVRLPDS